MFAFDAVISCDKQAFSRRAELRCRGLLPVEKPDFDRESYDKRREKPSQQACRGHGQPSQGDDQQPQGNHDTDQHGAYDDSRWITGALQRDSIR